MELLASEIRVLGCLLEKQRTTPDAYPLTLNSLRLACNQSTNRDPVVAYDEQEVRDALRRLERRGLVRFASGAGSRASKHRHMLGERMPVGEHGLAIMCVLMLRGAQTPGEIKQRTERLHHFAGLADVEQGLEELIEHGFVARLPRQPGRKEERYAHLLGAQAERESEVDFSGTEGQAPLTAGSVGAELDGGIGAQREGVEETRSALEAPQAELDALRERVDSLEGELALLKRELGIAAEGPT